MPIMKHEKAVSQLLEVSLSNGIETQATSTAKKGVYRACLFVALGNYTMRAI